MSEYLSKEEIKQWRSSLEKITLEEFAARLGKKIEEGKPTKDIVDIVLQGKPVISSSKDWVQSRTERLSSIAERSFERERVVSPTPFSINKQTKEDILKSPKADKAEKLKSDKAAVKEVVAKVQAENADADILREEVKLVFKKALTDREQKVFDHLAKNRNQIVYAKDLATLLDLPRDYVYKYIKNIRAKIDSDALRNADKGGFVLEV